MNLDEMEAALAAALIDPAYSHAENILVALREREARNIPHDQVIADLYRQFIVTT